MLLERVLELTGAERGCVVVREGGSYEQRFDVRFGRGETSEAERRFSRSVVRQAIESGRGVYSAGLGGDPRFADVESTRLMSDRAVIAAPLRHDGEVYGVLYLERPCGLDSFTAETRGFLDGLAELAGLFLRNALERQALVERNRSLEHDLLASRDLQGIVTRDSAMLNLLRTVVQVASSEATVLLLGETGTGKELVARALHWNSPHKARPFVQLHITALPGTLVESELFGHVRGAFTGAERDRAGRIASAEGGTLFLDEVGELPSEVQAKLLRFLQFGEIQRLGSDRVERVRTRIVAATHADLGALVQAGRFRQDLYFRLKVLELRLPPLRERKSDVPLLAAHFLRRHWTGQGQPPRFTERARAALGAYTWPGNVRELEHAVERACLLAAGPELDTELLPDELRAAAPVAPRRFQDYTNAELKAARAAAVAQVEREFLQGLMQRAGGNASQAARAAGLQRTYLHELLTRHGATSGPSRPEAGG